MRRKIRGDFDWLDSYSYFVPGVAELLILLVWFIVGVLAGNAVTQLFLKFLGNAAAVEYGTLVAYPLMFIPAMMYAGIRSRRNSYDRSGIKVDSSHFCCGIVLCAFAAILSTVALGFCTDAITAAMPPMPEFLENALKSMTTGNFFLNLLMVSIFAPVFEEWLCRGMVLRGLLGNRVKPVWAIVISSLVFAAIHANPWQAVPAFLMGCLFGYVYYRTGSLKLTMLMHCTNNTLALILSRIPSLEDADTWLDFLPSDLYWTIFTICVFLLFFLVRLFYRIPLEGRFGNCDERPPLFGAAE